MKRGKINPQNEHAQEAIPLGRGGAGYRMTPRLGASRLFPGMTSVQPEEEGVFQSRTGRTDRGLTGA